MKVLLDSHALIWWISGNERLSKVARSVIENGEIFVSAASAYELMAKMLRGRLKEAEDLMRNFETICEQQRFKLLPISVPHALYAASFDEEHRDPFDRLLAAQSILEEVPIVSIDPAIAKFGCQVVW